MAYTLNIPTKSPTGETIYQSGTNVALAQQGVSIPETPNIYLSSQKKDAQGNPVGEGLNQRFIGNELVSSQPISSASLSGGQTAINIPSSGGSTGAGGLSSSGGTIMGNNAGLDNLLTQAGYTKNKDGTYAFKAPETTQSDDLTSTIQSLFNNIPEKSSVLGSQEVQAQDAIVNQKRQVLQGYTNQLNTVVANAQAAQLAVTGQGRGIPETIIGGQQAQIAKEAAIQALPLQAQIAAATGDLTLAQEYRQQITAVLTEEANNNYDYKKTLFSAVWNYATEKEKRILDQRGAQAQDLQKVQVSLAPLLAQNNAPASVINAVRSATTATEATQAAGIYGVDNGTAQEQQLRSLQIQKAQQDLGGGGSGVGGSGASMAGLTPEQQKDPFIQKMLASSGGKPITDTFAQSLNKGLSVLGQLGVLEVNIKNTSTGPIAGLFRGANPWDTNAQTIKAQLNAIVPNLARGIYGEVGVLTDNDIKTYSSTLPNLKSTEDIRNAVLGITVDLIGKSVKRTLEVNAANGKDVSGFVDLYTEMQTTRDSIFAQIPGYKGNGALSLKDVGVTSADEDIFNSVAGTTGTTESTGGFFSNIWKGLFGN